MIITRSPLRISFCGGGSDLPGFCSREVGACISATLDKAVYVSVNQNTLNNKIRISYSQTELVDSIFEVQHDIVRETLRMFLEADPGWDPRGLEVVSVADLPAQTGLGSSGAFTVGLIQALQALRGRFDTPYSLARAASFVEMQRCRKPIGYQDQTASAFGGLRFYRFNDEGVFDAESLDWVPARGELQRRLLLVDMGSRSPSEDALSKLDLTDSKDTATIRSMSNLAGAFRDALVQKEIDECGSILASSWDLKASLEGTTTPEIDELYTFARENGAIGGKLCGAGGRGMFLLFTKSGSLARSHLAIAIQQKFKYRCLGVAFDPNGSRVVYSS